LISHFVGIITIATIITSIPALALLIVTAENGQTVTVIDVEGTMMGVLVVAVRRNHPLSQRRKRGNEKKV